MKRPTPSPDAGTDDVQSMERSQCYRMLESFTGCNNQWASGAGVSRGTAPEVPPHYIMSGCLLGHCAARRYLTNAKLIKEWQALVDHLAARGVTLQFYIVDSKCSRPLVVQLAMHWPHASFSTRRTKKFLPIRKKTLCLRCHQCSRQRLAQRLVTLRSPSLEIMLKRPMLVMRMLRR